MNAPFDPQLVYHVQQYIPGADGKELEHRIALLKARDWSAALRGRTTSFLATELAIHSHEIAGGMVFRVHETIPRLETAAELCRRLVAASLAADCLSNEDTPL